MDFSRCSGVHIKKEYSLYKFCFFFKEQVFAFYNLALFCIQKIVLLTFSKVVVLFESFKDFIIF